MDAWNSLTPPFFGWFVQPRTLQFCDFRPCLTHTTLSDLARFLHPSLLHNFFLFGHPSQMMSPSADLQIILGHHHIEQNIWDLLSVIVVDGGGNRFVHRSMDYWRTRRMTIFFDATSAQKTAFPNGQTSWVRHLSSPCFPLVASLQSAAFRLGYFGLL